jgi:hypothetical protein
MNYNLPAVEMIRPVSLRADVADRTKFGAWDCRYRAPRQAANIMAKPDEATAQRVADEACRPGHQNARQTRSSNSWSAAG